MIAYLSRLFRIAASSSWMKIILLLIAVYLLGGVAVTCFEADKPLGNFGNYSWWFVVTITTIGYGDLAPVTFGGRISAVGVILFGIGSIGLVLTKLVDSLVTFRRKKIRGLVEVNVKGHIVIFGYRKEVTQGLLNEILGDEHHDQSVVLCSDAVEENPFLGIAHFVKGDITSDDVLLRARVADASHVVICGENDHESSMALLAATSVNKTAHMVVSLQNPKSQVHICRINPKAECILDLSVLLTAQALQDPGTSSLFLELIGNNVGTSDLHRLNLPEGFPATTFRKLSTFLKEKFDSLLIAVAESHENSSRVEVNPGADSAVKGGMSVFYISCERIKREELEQLFLVLK